MKIVLRRLSRPLLAETRCLTFLAAILLLVAPATSETASPATNGDLVTLTEIPPACTTSDTRTQRSCLKDVGTRVRKLSSVPYNVQLMQGLPILDRKATAAALCDMVKTWADQSLADIRSVWSYLERHEPDWP